MNRFAGWLGRNHVVIGMVLWPFALTALHQAPAADVPWIMACIQAGVPLGLWSAWQAAPPGSPPPTAPAGPPATIAPGTVPETES